MASSDEHSARPSRRARSPSSRSQLSRHLQTSFPSSPDDVKREMEEERELRRQRRMRRESWRREGSMGIETVRSWRAGRGDAYGRRGERDNDARSEDTEEEDESDSETGEGSSLLGSSRGRGRRRSRDDEFEPGESASSLGRWDGRAMSPGGHQRRVSPKLCRAERHSPPLKPQPRPPAPMPARRPPPPQSRRPINIDFRFPTSFSRSGLPSYPHNQYLPLRLLSLSADPNSPEARHQADLREEEAAWWRNNRHYERRDHVEEGRDGNLMFPALLAFVLVFVPVLVITVVLGAVFTAAKVDA